MPDVVVVGAGVTGASVAYHLACRGASVTLVEAALPGAGVTASSFAWIGASGVPPGPAAALRRAAADEYRRLEQELSGVRVRWCGSLCWADGPPPDDVPDGRHLVAGDALAELEPHLRRAPPWAVHTPGDGAVDPVAVTEALVGGARRHGARVLPGTSVTALVVTHGRVRGARTTGGEVLAASTVVVATGADAAGLCAPLGVDPHVGRSPAVLLQLDAPRDLVRSVLVGPHAEVRQAGAGTLLATLAHAGETSRSEVAGRARRAVPGIAGLLDDGERIRLRSTHVGWRPMPADGEPVVGPVPGVDGLHLAVMHSGVTLAPVAGRLLAEQLVDGVEVPELRGCRPARFTAAR